MDLALLPAGGIKRFVRQLFQTRRFFGLKNFPGPTAGRAVNFHADLLAAPLPGSLIGRSDIIKFSPG
jgi:hypothetical protein